jgi:hypothetical protein
MRQGPKKGAVVVPWGRTRYISRPKEIEENDLIPCSQRQDSVRTLIQSLFSIPFLLT